ncbi:MAG: phage Gp37/Gp68 family protein [Pseudomonadota bacterium]
MATKSKIEWTGVTWNPVTGCSKISAGCKNCYAERMAYRLQAMGQPNYRFGFDVVEHPHMLELPLKWKKPQTVFVNSMSDLFHKDVSASYIKAVLKIMKHAHWHTFQVLTKRSERLLELGSELEWPDNVWMGVTVECDKYLNRIDDLRKIPAKVKFLSLEPLLGPLNKLNLKKIDWIIVGGESGPYARPMDEEWVLGIMRQCKGARVPFFFKQWGGFNKKKAGRTLKGRIWNERPMGHVESRVAT